MVKEPEDMEELVYFTRRAIGNGRIMAWVYKQPCPKCGKGLMSKPKDEKTGKPKIRATEYVCEHCNNTAEKKEYEETLQAEATYKCPHCGKEGESTIPFKRKAVDGTQALRFECQHCNGKIDVTKKMKEKKSK